MTLTQLEEKLSRELEQGMQKAGEKGAYVFALNHLHSALAKQRATIREFVENYEVKPCGNCGEMECSQYNPLSELLFFLDNQSKEKEI